MEKELVEQENQKELACIAKSRKTAWTALICTLACCVITDTAFWIDLWNFVSGHVKNVIGIIEYGMTAGSGEDSLTVYLFITIFPQLRSCAQSLLQYQGFHPALLFLHKLNWDYVLYAHGPLN